ncbi:MAG: 4Fe-4S dicluster domain-containing protein [Syntrophaceae bacterium]|nr:4Fe-4S dicluster domain-containing protein [Syntrophaceae bacterium]
MKKSRKKSSSVAQTSTGNTMIDIVKEQVKTLMDSGQISAFLGLKEKQGSVFPFLYKSVQDLDEGFSLGDLEKPGQARYPIAKLLMRIVKSDAETSYGALFRGCDERAWNELLRWNQVNSPQRVFKVGIACPSELAQKHECRKPFPDEYVAGEKVDPVENISVQEVMGKDLGARLEYWMGEFDRCIKCYGCRNVCPVCFCNVCTLEQDSLIKTGDIPPENPMFHLTRAVHMAGRCIDCNLCTEACPSDIPLRILYKRVAEIISDEFGYVTGEIAAGKSPLNILGSDPGHTAAND